MTVPQPENVGDIYRARDVFTGESFTLVAFCWPTEVTDTGATGWDWWLSAQDGHFGTWGKWVADYPAMELVRRAN